MSQQDAIKGGADEGNGTTNNTKERIYIQFLDIKIISWKGDKMDDLQVKEVAPLRNLGFWAIWALGVGSVVGDGIFLLLGEGIAQAGPSAALAFLLAGFIQMFMMVGLGELAVGMPDAGAMSVWVERFMGKWWGFLSGIAFALGWVVTGGSTGLAIGRITCWFFPSLDVDTWTVVFALIFISLFAILNIVGTMIAARTQLYMVIGLMSLMALFGIIGIKNINPANFQPFMPFGWKGFVAAIPLGTYAYMGAVTLCTSGSECKNPKDLPKALVWASLTFLFVYTLDQFVVEGVIPFTEISLEASPFTLAASRVLGYWGGLVINIAAWVAAATTILMGTIYAPSRIFFSNAKRGFLPKCFAYLHPKTRTPIVGIVAVWIASIALILIGFYNPDFIYVTLSNQMVLAWGISWTLALVAALLYRTKCRKEVESNGWMQPLFPFFPIAGILGIAMVFYFTFASTLLSLLIGVIWIGALALFYRFSSLPRINAMKKAEVA